MSSEISLGNQYLWVSNLRLFSLISFAVELGGEAAQSEEERGWVERLRRFGEEAFPGIGFDLAERFPGLQEKKFWARIFSDIARRIFLRQLGEHDQSFWQASAIGDSYVVARMLTGAVQEVEPAWIPTLVGRLNTTAAGMSQPMWILSRRPCHQGMATSVWSKPAARRSGS